MKLKWKSKSWKGTKVRKFEWHQANTRRPWKLKAHWLLWYRQFSSSLSQQNWNTLLTYNHFRYERSITHSKRW